MPDLITLLNALCGFGAIVAIHYGMVQLSCTLVLLAAIADGLDGSMARHMGGSDIGGSLDSLADVISFGVAPAIIITSFIANCYTCSCCFYLISVSCGLHGLTYLNLTVLFSKACL